MGTNHAEIFAALGAPFQPGEVKQYSRDGRAMYYITARVVANRLDNVIGPENWDFEVKPWGQEALIGTLILRLPDGTVVRKSDVGGKADMKAADDADKSAASDCLKRCASLFGVARYLYRDGVPLFTSERHDFEYAAAQQQQSQGRGSWGQQGQPPRSQQPPPARQQPERPEGQQYGDPKTGRQLFAWTKQMEERSQFALLKYLNSYAKHQEFPGKMIDWDEAQVSAAYAEARRKLQAVQDGEPSEEALAN